jgi:hypothetical protein
LVGGGLGIELGGLIPEFYILPTPLTWELQNAELCGAITLSYMFNFTLGL